MTVTSPPPPTQDELEALIEEARRRARRRRPLIAAAVLGVVLLAGALAGIVIGSRVGSSGEHLRPGFHAVQARGPVRHALIEDLRSGGTTISLATGGAHRTRLTYEIWWDPRSGLYRTVYREDGVRLAESVQQNCFTAGKTHMCIAPSPFDLRVRGLGWPLKAGAARQVGTGSFRGRRVVWIEGLYRPQGGKVSLSGEQVAYDALAHVPVALRTIMRDAPPRFRGKIFSLRAVTMLPELRAKDVVFAVPDGGAPRNPGTKQVDFRKASRARAREVLGRPPLWLGPGYRGHRLRFVQTAREGTETKNRSAVGLVPFVRLDYGPFRIDEYGDRRPPSLERGGRRGTVLAARGDVIFERDGVVVVAVGGGLGPALALAKALRPVPAG